jgi:formylglycine-generating enzyme required for sulfatase activity
MNAPAAAAPEAAAPSTTDLFITVPETTLPNGTVVSAFRVGQYVCTQGTDGKAAITAEGTPWVRIDFEEAKAACIAAGYALLTELQALAIAWNVSLQDANWSGGKVGEGTLRMGLHKGTVYGAQPGTYESPDADEQRWFVLSNGERICDVAGNVYSWIFDDVQGDEQGLVAKRFDASSPSLTTPPHPSMEKGVGWYPNAGSDWSGYALVRGGCWGSGARAGAFHLGGDWPGYRHDYVGFRCTTQPGL